MNCAEARKVVLEQMNFLVNQKESDTERPHRETVHAALAHVRTCEQPKCHGFHLYMLGCLETLRGLDNAEEISPEPPGLLGWDGDY